jgi:phosphoribosyl-dephospho-CoA transferase
MNATAYAPHDLLVASADAFVFADDSPPAWVRDSLSRWPWAVVRRAQDRGAAAPVGVRGATRGERYAAWLPLCAITACARPEQLTADRAWLRATRARALPHFDALNRVEQIMEQFGLKWGPVGAMGYELASGRPCLTQDSDIDIIVRVPVPFTRTQARALLAAFAALQPRIDAQLEATAGAFALAEFTQDCGEVVLRTAYGPRRVANPWHG